MHPNLLGLLSCTGDGLTHSLTRRASLNYVPLYFYLFFMNISYAFPTVLGVHKGLLGLRCPRPSCHLWSCAGLTRHPLHSETASICAFLGTCALETPCLIALNRFLMQALNAGSEANSDTGLCTPINFTLSGGTTSRNPRNGALRVSRHGHMLQCLPAVRLS